MASLLCTRSKLPSLLQRGSSTRWSSGISRMLDMGGAPSASNTKHAPREVVDACKNSKLQAVAFDFSLLRRSIQKTDDIAKKAHTLSHSSASATSSSLRVQPDASKVQEVASMLNVRLGDDTPRGGVTRFQKDDMTLLQSDFETTTKPADAKPATTTAASTLGGRDVRAKYAAKLKNKVQGGVAGLEVAHQQREDSLKHGDASLYAAARKVVSQHDTSERKWMAMTGTGQLLTYLTSRSTKIALLPPLEEPEQEQQTRQHMDDFTKQLQDSVVIDVAIAKGKDAKEVLRKTTKDLKLKEEVLLVVSDRDDYLKAARDDGMMTCRVRPLNARRGNVSTSYTVEDIKGVEDIVNVINGISFKAVLNR